MREIKKIIGKKITGISIDNLEINNNFQLEKGEDVELTFSDSSNLLITTDQIPHNFGDSRLEFQIGVAEKIKSKMNLSPIKSVTIYKWKEKGIFNFSYFEPCQVVFELEEFTFTVGFYEQIIGYNNFIFSGDVILKRGGIEINEEMSKIRVEKVF